MDSSLEATVTPSRCLSLRRFEPETSTELGVFFSSVNHCLPSLEFPSQVSIDFPNSIPGSVFPLFGSERVKTLQVMAGKEKRHKAITIRNSLFFLLRNNGSKKS
jgi:hypothetical protein